MSHGYVFAENFNGLKHIEEAVGEIWNVLVHRHSTWRSKAALLVGKVERLCISVVVYDLVFTVSRYEVDNACIVSTIQGKIK